MLSNILCPPPLFFFLYFYSTEYLHRLSCSLLYELDLFCFLECFISSLGNPFCYKFNAYYTACTLDILNTLFFLVKKKKKLHMQVFLNYKYFLLTAPFVEVNPYHPDREKPLPSFKVKPLFQLPEPPENFL